MPKAHGAAARSKNNKRNRSNCGIFELFSLDVIK